MSDPVRDFIAAATLEVVPAASTPLVATGYGTDLVCVDDIDLQLREVDPDSTEGLAQDLYHRITTAHGSLPDDPDYGLDLRQFLSHGTTATELAGFASMVTLELQKDDRVAVALVTFTASAGGKALQLTCDITPEDPTIKRFEMLVTVTDGRTLLEVTSL